MKLIEQISACKCYDIYLKLHSSVIDVISFLILRALLVFEIERIASFLVAASKKRNFRKQGSEVHIPDDNLRCFCNQLSMLNLLITGPSRQ